MCIDQCLILALGQNLETDVLTSLSLLFSSKRLIIKTNDVTERLLQTVGRIVKRITTATVVCVKTVLLEINHTITKTDVNILLNKKITVTNSIYKELAIIDMRDSLAEFQVSSEVRKMNDLSLLDCITRNKILTLNNS